MINLKIANIGFNKYCGPAVLSILTGKDTDECAMAISKINGQWPVKEVRTDHLVKAANKLGFIWEEQTLLEGVSLYRAITSISLQDGIYAIVINSSPKISHIVCVEIQDKKAYFNDNHTKEPIPAGSSARLMQKVIEVYKVIAKPKPELLPEKVEEVLYYRCGYCCVLDRKKEHINHRSDCEYRIALEANK